MPLNLIKNDSNFLIIMERFLNFSKIFTCDCVNNTINCLLIPLSAINLNKKQIKPLTNFQEFLLNFFNFWLINALITLPIACQLH